MVVSLLNILVFYIMLLNHSLKHTSQPAGHTVWSSLSDQMKHGAASTENSSPSLSVALPAPQKQVQPTGREFPRERGETEGRVRLQSLSRYTEIYSYFKSQ